MINQSFRLQPRARTSPITTIPSSQPLINDVYCIAAVLLAHVAHALFLKPAYHGMSVGELLYASTLSVATGALIGFFLFDRLGQRRLVYFVMAATALIAAFTLVNEALVEPAVFQAGPINMEGVYYGAIDAGAASAVFILIRLLKLSRHLAISEAEPVLAWSDPTDALVVRMANQRRRIVASEILYMKAERDFTHVYCAGATHFVSESLKDILARSSALGMVRVHKSFAVNLRHIDGMTGAKIDIGDRSIPVGRKFRPDLEHAWAALAKLRPDDRRQPLQA